MHLSLPALKTTSLEDGARANVRYQVVLKIADLLRREVKAHGVKTIADELDMNAAHLRRLMGNWTDLNRDQLQRLSTWTRTREQTTNLLDVIQHPLWEIVSGKHVQLYIGCDEHGATAPNDESAKTQLMSFFTQDGCKAIPHLVKVPAKTKRPLLAKQIERAMMTQNCVFICGPRVNAASECAASLLWKAKPFDTTADNRAKVPFHIGYCGGPEETLDSSFAVLGRDAKDRAILVKQKQIRLAFPYKSAAHWQAASTKPEFDFAVVSICRKPLGTTKNVMSLVVMGLTGFATHSACTSIAGEYLHVDSLKDGEPEALVFCVKFKKGPGPDARQMTDGCRWVRAPWDYWPDGATTSRRANSANGESLEA